MSQTTPLEQCGSSRVTRCHMPGRTMLTRLIILMLSSVSFGGVEANTELDNRCSNTTHENPLIMLEGLHLYVALYSGEFAKCNQTKHAVNCGEDWAMTTQLENNPNGGLAAIISEETIWYGYDVALLERLSQLGGFNYTIINMGNSADIDDYTPRAKVVLGHDTNITTTPYPTNQSTANLIAQGTWRVNFPRSQWAVWSVPVLSEGVQLLSRAPVIQQRTALSIFAPFDIWLWVLLFAVVVLIWILLLFLARRKVGTIEEISSAELLFYSISSCFGKGELDHNKANTQAFSIVWIFFCFLVTTVYAANLTAILAHAPEVVFEVSTVDQAKTNGKVFCVQKGAANERFFGDHRDYGNKGYGSDRLLVSAKEKITSQIDGVLKNNITETDPCVFDFNTNESNCCDVSEVTREDFYQWAKEHPNERCKIELVGQPFVKRARGMMTATKYACVIMSINSIYHKFSNYDCSVEKPTPLICDAADLANVYFPTPKTCDHKKGNSKINEIKLEEITSVFYVLVIGAVVGGLASYCGRVHRTSWPVNILLRTEESFKKKFHHFFVIEKILTKELDQRKLGNFSTIRKNRAARVLEGISVPQASGSFRKRPSQQSDVTSDADAAFTHFPVENLSETEEVHSDTTTAIEPNDIATNADERWNLIRHSVVASAIDRPHLLPRRSTPHVLPALRDNL
eukprot:m.164754 g.164754  ORF g.164754 m.164754 type:complete len:685 (-) comp31353_c0_seq1:194-2248(-)